VKTYDVVFILDEKRVEDGGDSFAKEVAAYVKSIGGNVTETINMGRRQFVRSIGKHTAGLYWEFVTELDPGTVDALKEKYRLNPSALRLMVVIYAAPQPAGKEATIAAVSGRG